MCGRQSPCWLLVLLFLVLPCTARTAWGQEPSASSTSLSSPPSAPNTPEPLPFTISGWQVFDELWTSLQTELTASAEDSTRLSVLLAEQRTAISALQFSLEQSRQLLTDSERSLEAERQALAVAISDRNAALGMAERSRRLVGILGGIAAVFGGVAVLALVF